MYPLCMCKVNAVAVRRFNTVDRASAAQHHSLLTFATAAVKSDKGHIIKARDASKLDGDVRKHLHLLSSCSVT